jgi:hypothetical protein
MRVVAAATAAMNQIVGVPFRRTVQETGTARQAAIPAIRHGPGRWRTTTDAVNPSGSTHQRIAGRKAKAANSGSIVGGYRTAGT